MEYVESVVKGCAVLSFPKKAWGELRPIMVVDCFLNMLSENVIMRFNGASSASLLAR